MRVEVRGKVYQDVPTAARYLKVKEISVYASVIRGTTDTLGLGRGNRTNRRGGRPAKEFKVGTTIFPSMSAASRALGFNSNYIQLVLAKGKKRSRENLYAAMLKYQAEQDRLLR